MYFFIPFSVRVTYSATYILQETLRVKDEELQNLARELRSRDSTIKEIADKLSETAEAAVAAASAAHTMDEQRKIVCVEFERLTKDSERQQEAAKLKVMRPCHIQILLHRYACLVVY